MSLRNGWSSLNKNNEVGAGGDGGTTAWAGITSVLTFCREVDVVVGCADTTAFGVLVCASWAANLMNQSNESVFFYNIVEKFRNVLSSVILSK